MGVIAMPGPEELVVWVSIAALRLAEGKSSDELSVLGAVFTQLGDTLATMAARMELLEETSR